MVGLVDRLVTAVLALAVTLALVLATEAPVTEALATVALVTVDRVDQEATVETTSLVELPKLRCEACEDYLVPRRHTGQQHVEPSWMCGAAAQDCIMSGVCLSCQKLLAWFRTQDEALGGG